MTRSERNGDDHSQQGQPSASYTGHAHGDDLARTLSDMARSLQSEGSFDDTLGAIVSAAAHTVPGAERAGLTMVQGRRKVSNRAATDDLVREADRAQYETGQGPCLDAAYERRTVRLTDMASEQRWPAFTRRALQLGMRSMLSFQLYVHDDDLGALNLYSGQVDAFDDESENIGLLFASHAAIAMAGSQKEHDLSLAISARDLIGQAKGILMERHKITGDHAFRLLARVSQHSNIRLAEVARHLVETGDLTAAGSRQTSR
jgi:transcriptional regulator with GAF, ATPase, and Fis domain